MIDSIYGRLIHKEPTNAIIEVGGIRIKIHISINTYERLASVGSNAELLTYLHVREDILDLYGFDSPDQRNLFLMLIGISGIGPRSAMTILSGASTSEFKKRIIAGDVKSLTVIPGIGTKTAKRIIIELKGKFVEEHDEDILSIAGPDRVSDVVNDAITALLSLGYNRSQTFQALKKLEQAGGLEGSLEDIIKKALSKM